MNALFGQVIKDILTLLQAQDTVGEDDGNGAKGGGLGRRCAVGGVHWVAVQKTTSLDAKLCGLAAAITMGEIRRRAGC